MIIIAILYAKKYSKNYYLSIQKCYIILKMLYNIFMKIFEKKEEN